MRLLSILPLIFLLSLQANAQNLFRVSGKILETSTASPLPGAACAILLQGDSSVLKGGTSDASGRFELDRIPPGSYLLKIQFLGYRTRYKSFSISNKDEDLGSIGLEESARNLAAVKVEGQQAAVVQKKDTAEYNASAFKTNRDATTEDLLTKMPGVTVQDGKVSVQGEEVKKVLIDNKPFFGDDPNAALKNLPAEVVDKIQVFDQMSDQSRFTGFNDGNTSKTINIVTRGGMKNGNFGRAYAGAGTDERFKSGLTFNRFQGNRRITVLGQFNNINEQNFSMSDLAGMMGGGGGGRGGQGGGRGGMGGGGMMGGMGGGRNGGFNQGAMDFFVNSKRGIVRTGAGGINYSDNWGSKVEVSANYFFNQSRNNSDQNTVRNYALDRDSGQVYLDTSFSITDNLNHRFNMRMDIKLDSMNSILYTPRITFQDVSSENTTDGQNLIKGFQINRNLNSAYSNQQSYNMNHEVLFRHKFAKKGRTISLNTNLGTNAAEGESGQTSVLNFLAKDPLSETRRQESDLLKSGWSIQNTLTYTEPLGEKSMLSLNYALNTSVSETDKSTWQLDESGNRLRQDSLLSNKFRSETPSQYAGLGYAYNSEKSNFNLNVNFQQSRLLNNRTFPLNVDIRRDFRNILPSLMWRYSFNDKKSLRIFYRTSANAPSIDQLQDVVNNSNPLQLYAGNRDLRQDFQHSLFLRFMSTGAGNSSFFWMLGGSTARHFIGNTTFLASRDTVTDGIPMRRGAQLIRPKNMDGQYSLRSFLMYSRPLAFIKSNLNSNAGLTYSRTPGMLNGRMNYAESPSWNLGLGLSSNISKAVDFTLSYNFSYTSVKNSLVPSQNTSYSNQIIGAKANVVLKESLVLNADFSQNLLYGLSQGINTNFALLNLGLGYKFLKGKQAELRATVFDLLSQNTSISRSITETYTEDLRTNNLGRFFMLTFTYTLRVFKPAEKMEGMHMMPPGMIRPPGWGPPQN